MQRTFKYRAYANKQTIANAEHWLELCRYLYNAALEQRIISYRQTKKSISCFRQINQIKELRQALPEYKGVLAQVLCNVIQRLDFTVGRFIDGNGFPRFKGKDRYNSFTLGQVGNGWKLEDNYLIVSRIGKFKLKLHRPIQGTIKNIIVKRKPTGKWYICFNCDDVPEQILPPSDKPVGIDVGIKSFCVDSDGNRFDNQRLFINSYKQLRVRSRKINRRVKGSKRRAKASKLMAKTHEHITNQRNDFLHKLARRYIEQYGEIYVEKIRIKDLKRNHNIANSISDVSWGKFFVLLSSKAEGAGRKFIQVNPKNTSQLCSGCGKIVKKTLNTRIHNCPYCGLYIDRDYNAALNILYRGLGLKPSVDNVLGCQVRRLRIVDDTNVTGQRAVLLPLTTCYIT